MFLLIGCVVVLRRNRCRFIDFQRPIAAHGEGFRVRRCVPGNDAFVRWAAIVALRKRLL
jgi:hypothetical protein